MHNQVYQTWKLEITPTIMLMFRERKNENRGRGHEKESG